MSFWPPWKEDHVEDEDEGTGAEDGDDDGENVGHSIDDEGLSDEVYSERHAKHLEVMRIEYEEKKKRQAELKEQKKLEH